MATTVKGDRAVRRCVEKYLGEINAALGKAGVSRGEIQNVVDDVRAQIAEMLATRTQGEPTLQDAQAVVAELDAPESYASETEDLKQKPLAPRRLSRHALWGALIPFLFMPASALLVLVFRVIVARSTSPEEVPSGSQSMPFLFALPWLVGIICSFFLGAVAISKIRRSAGRLYGLRLAFAEVLLAPLLILAAFSYIPAMSLCLLFCLSEEKYVPAFSFVIWCVLAWFLGGSVWRSIRKAPASSPLDTGTR